MTSVDLIGWAIVLIVCGFALFGVARTERRLRASRKHRELWQTRQGRHQIRLHAEHKAARGHIMWADSDLCVATCPKCALLDTRGVTTMYRDRNGRWRDRHGWVKGPERESTGRIVTVGSEDWERIFGPVPTSDMRDAMFTATAPPLPLEGCQPTPPPPPFSGICIGCGMDDLYDNRRDDQGELVAPNHCYYCTEFKVLREAQA